MKLGIFPSSDGKEMKKKSVMHVQNCCFANLNELLFDVLVVVAVVEC